MGLTMLDKTIHTYKKYIQLDQYMSPVF